MAIQTASAGSTSADTADRDPRLLLLLFCCCTHCSQHTDKQALPHTPNFVRLLLTRRRAVAPAKRKPKAKVLDDFEQSPDHDEVAELNQYDGDFGAMNDHYGGGGGGGGVGGGGYNDDDDGGGGHHHGDGDDDGANKRDEAGGDVTFIKRQTSLVGAAKISPRFAGSHDYITASPSLANPCGAPLQGGGGGGGGVGGEAEGAGGGEGGGRRGLRGGPGGAPGGGGSGGGSGELRKQGSFMSAAEAADRQKHIITSMRRMAEVRRLSDIVFYLVFHPTHPQRNHPNIAHHLDRYLVLQMPR